MASLALLTVGSLGCLVAPVVLPTALSHTGFEAPLDVDFEATPIGSKVGTAQTKFFREPIFTGLPIAAWGNASIEEAAREGQISNVTHVDYAILNVLGIYMESTVRAFGD